MAAVSPISNPATIAYFSMEVGLDAAMPTYSGGLGVLAGDALRAAADLGIPMVGVTLLHRKGYFRQHLDAQGRQTESPAAWQPEPFLQALPARSALTLEGRLVLIRAWRYVITGVSGREVPVFFLDTALEQNDPWDQTLTDCLYGGDARYRLAQEGVLGLGGVAMLRTLGLAIGTYHMNEGHSALLALGLLQEQNAGRFPPLVTPERRLAVRRRCVFTTHTPVPAGQDQFPPALVAQVLGADAAAALHAGDCCLNGTLNMTYLGLYFAHYVNGVAMRHGEISHGMFPNYPISSITNGVHSGSWAAPPWQALYDRHIPQWRRDNFYLRYAISIPHDEIMQAHAEAKRLMLAEVHKRTGVALDPNVFTLGFARRATGYKRADLLFSDLGRLRQIVAQVGPLQVVYAGKAHPRDDGGKALIARIFQAAAELQGQIRVLYLEDYDMTLARYLTSGADVWLNTPQKPQEASGTSGMKAALNGVPSLSILDGWWVEGCLEGVTGWAIGEDGGSPSDPRREVASLYGKLQFVVMPLFYTRPMAFAEVQRAAIALNGSYYNAERMMSQYLQNAYGTPAD
jgi:starch phosphorylase